MQVLEDPQGGWEDVSHDHKKKALGMLWCMRRIQLSRPHMVYLLIVLDSSVSSADVAPWPNRLSSPASKLASLLELPNDMQGTFCALPGRLDSMYQARVVPARYPMQLGGSWYKWVTIAVDGTNRWNRGCIHCAVAGRWCGSSDQGSV